MLPACRQAGTTAAHLQVGEPRPFGAGATPAFYLKIKPCCAAPNCTGACSL